MAKFDNNVEMAYKKFNKFLNSNFKNKLQKNFLYNIEKITINYIWKDIQLRNQLLPDEKKEEHKTKIRLWMEEERQRILAEKAR